MPVFSTTTAARPFDGATYCANQPMPALENDLFLAGLEDPIAILFGQACLAIVTFAIQGQVSSQTSYVVMQTDLGDGNWVDVAWCTFTGTAGQANIFVLSSSGIGQANSFQQSRVVGVAPSPANGSNAMTLGGRLRFVGKGSVQGSSSSSSASGAAGLAANVLVSIKYKLVGLR